jgi:hypothetical protein
LHFEYYTTAVGANNTDYKSRKNVVVSIIVECVDKMKMAVGEIMEVLLKTYGVPEDKRVRFFFSICEIALMGCKGDIVQVYISYYIKGITALYLQRDSYNGN